MSVPNASPAHRTYRDCVLDTLPLFPLGTVLLPGAILPLHIFEPRYRQLTTDLITGVVPDRRFGVIAVRPGWDIEDGVLEAVHGVGCSAELLDAQRGPEGQFDIIGRGVHRFHLLEIDPTTAPYLTATVEWLPDVVSSARTALPTLAMAARGAHRRYCSVAWHKADWQSPGDVDPAVLAHVLASDCLLTLDDRQALLEQRCPVRRLRMVRSMVAREAEILGKLGAVPVPAGQLMTQLCEN